MTSSSRVQPPDSESGDNITEFKTSEILSQRFAIIVSEAGKSPAAKISEAGTQSLMVDHNMEYHSDCQ